MLIGYARTSSKDQNLDRQLDSLKEAGCEKIYAEKISAFAERREFKKMISDLKPGDVVLVHDQDRLARDPVLTYAYIGAIQDKGAKIKSLSQGEIDTTNPDEEFQISIRAAFAKLVYEKTRVAQREGIGSAKKRGKHLGRPHKFTLEQTLFIVESVENGKSKSEVARLMLCSRDTIIRICKQEVGI